MSNFKITSPEFKEQDVLQKAHEFNGFDGDGQNRSLALQWQDAPEGTQSFAVTLYDPDAPTGSGFWHWVLYDIPANVTQLAQGAGSTDKTGLPGIGIQAQNDYGTTGFGGPCPPKGSAAHRYIFTVHALHVASLGLPASGVTNAVVRFMIHQNTLATATLIGLYQRP
ncbi:YbhB/YbcL family Raf kinase inhibitor-like protein [Verminephrobacter eiseniae]|uniref:YbhB/YbcL family Raf kinase inhibitor-like protein n=1 Tax=Verminephrobacter eiseniae TaxID=364317 RepID=UPI002237AAAC|nr:YbhB/YbcL family Raf kinase inhibitor-like protein [Verminephrobacter eiseniae]MCW5231580.1 YbhB/YbcL family Raf kinase inhibitor-like protein [Verminephrobacter eiseniae]MCW5259905.1 YbhB/YbcL family Raf kinase inhibitor-like protein [Verminephrobacter eiseniae]MCW5293309.1 YbhB/YbcL family Raf kinase inhibitor-like protein [Verminephrobacter eiseniae]MCW8187533.1 YbhB/YbcL family Raf kinase inhibitor-like protein [Verminephrobacter eiseniae]MCW8225870.1 YbhB/YbcL family Raf kinase inhibit